MNIHVLIKIIFILKNVLIQLQHDKTLTINLKKNIHIFVKSIKKVLSTEFFQQSCIIGTSQTIQFQFLF